MRLTKEDSLRSLNRKTGRARLQSCVAEVLESRRLMSADVLTFHNDNARDGANLNETTLTPANVQPGSFGKLFSVPVDGYTYAQPLVVSNVATPAQGTHDIVYVATEHDSVYAYDANSNGGPNGGLIWKDSFINPSAGVTTVPAADTGSTDILPEIGITGTPVIDKTTNTLYVVAKTKEVVNGVTNYVQRLHALDLATGAEKFGGPIEIQASVPGSTPVGNDGNGNIIFNPLRENEREALTFSNGNVYITFASHSDNGPYHGWALSYTVKNGKMQQAAAWDVTPAGSEGGIWQSSGGPAVDAQGNLYLQTGNGDFNASIGNYSDSFVKLSPDLKVLDSFTPANQDYLKQNDLDLGAGGTLLLPDQGGAHPQEILGAGKQGTVYVLDRNNLGGFNSTDNAVQEISKALPGQGGSFDSPAYFNGTVYYGGNYDNLRAFSLSNGLLSTTPSSTSPDQFYFPGPSVSISANGTQNGIVWALNNAGFGTHGPAVLRAYDASNLSNELYTSNTAANGADAASGAVKFTVPTVADGHVYVPGQTALTIYGLFQQNALPAAPSNVRLSPADHQITVTWNGVNGAGSYSVYRATTPGGEGATPLARGLTGTSYVDSGLTDGKTYYYKVTATNTVGEGQASPELSAVPNQTLAPAAPTKLAASTGSYQQISLTWTAPATATRYNIYRSTTPGGEGSTPWQTGVSATNYTDSTVSIDGTYYYQVSALNSVGEGARSAEITATPLPVPAPTAAPQNIQAASNDSLVTVTWDSVQYATDYHVYRSTSAGGEGATPFPANVSGTTFYDYSVTNGTTYYYQITAFNNAGEGARSSEVTGEPNIAPITPTGGHATLISTNEIDLAWNDNSNNETNFRITRKAGNEANFSVVALLPANNGPTDSFQDMTVVPGTTYDYHIEAVNSAGASDRTGVATMSLAAAPDQLSASASAGQIALTWAPSSGASTYNVYRSATPGGEGAIPVQTGLATSAFTDTGVPDGQTYYYQISAVDSTGEGPLSAEVGAATPSPAPTPTPAPTALGSFGVINRRSVRLTVDTANGAEVILSLSGGTGEAFQDPDGQSLDLTVTGGRLTIHSRHGRAGLASLDVTSALANLEAPTTDLSGTFSAGGAITHAVLGDVTGTITASSIGSLTASSLTGATILAGASVSTGRALNTGSYGPGSINALTVRGAISNSIIAAGLVPGQTSLLDGSESVAGGAASFLRSVAVDGSVDDASRFVAGAARSARFGSRRINPATDGRFLLL